MSGRRKKALDALRLAMIAGSMKPRAFRKAWRRDEPVPSGRLLRRVDASMRRAKAFRASQVSRPVARPKARVPRFAHADWWANRQERARRREAGQRERASRSERRRAT